MMGSRVLRKQVRCLAGYRLWARLPLVTSVETLYGHEQAWRVCLDAEMWISGVVRGFNSCCKKGGKINDGCQRKTVRRVLTTVCVCGIIMLG